MSDQELIKGCLNNERRAQNALYEKYFPLMSSVALRYTNDQNEAIQRLNEGFFKVLTKLKEYNDDFALATWIRRILVNHMIDEFRKNQSYISNVHLTDYDEVEVGYSINEGAQKLEADELRNLLKKLPEMSQNVFNLFAIDGYKHREIADLLGVSEGTSKWHVNEARKRLKLMIETLYQTEKKTLEIAR
jgi:RNA polymerase sigma-70 factor (ECF subfamily)